MDETLRIVLSYVFLFFLFLGLAANISIKNFKNKFIIKNERKRLLTGLLCQFIVMPFFGYVSVKLTGVDSTLGMTLLIITSSPGGAFSNWWCSLMNADLALSIAMTTTSSFISLFMLPLNLFIYVKLTYSKVCFRKTVDHKFQPRIEGKYF